MASVSLTRLRRALTHGVAASLRLAPFHEQWRCKGTLQAPALASIDQCDAQSDSPAQTWLTDIALYLSALLNGAMQHDVAFALRYGAERRAFRKPIMLHQRVATRLADMLIATQGTYLFLRALTLAEPNISIALVRQLIRHIAAESVSSPTSLFNFAAHTVMSQGCRPLRV